MIIIIITINKFLIAIATAVRASQMSTASLWGISIIYQITDITLIMLPLCELRRIAYQTLHNEFVA